MEKVPLNSHSANVHYVPHYPVTKDLTATLIWIDFDCSCHQSKKYATLNDCLSVYVHDFWMMFVPLLCDFRATFLHWSLILRRHSNMSNFTIRIKIKPIFFGLHNYTGLYTGGSRGFDRTPYFCSLKLILSLNIKHCMVMCAIVCRNLRSGIFWMLKYLSVWGLRPHTPHLGLLTRSN